MAAKKKTATKRVRKPKRVEGTNREHRAVDAEKLREAVRGRKAVNGAA